MTFRSSIIFTYLLLASAFIQGEARTKKDGDFDFNIITDYVGDFLKVTLACSPLLAIGAILFMAREDDETEKAKLEASKCCTKK